MSTEQVFAILIMVQKGILDQVKGIPEGFGDVVYNQPKPMGQANDQGLPTIVVNECDVTPDWSEFASVIVYGDCNIGRNYANTVIPDTAEGPIVLRDTLDALVSGEAGVEEEKSSE